jgi:4'-phosphopantetheinyl transferase
MSVSPVVPLRDGEVRVYTLNTGDRDRVRFVARMLLAGLLGVEPEEITFEYGPQGKPYLQNDRGLHFSVSHSNTASMIAVTRVAAVGVDIERQHMGDHTEKIMRRFFTPEDIEAITTDENRALRFARAWTRAEATVKVRGASVWEAATPDPSVRVRELVAPDGYAASVAVASESWDVVQVDASPDVL